MDTTKMIEETLDNFKFELIADVMKYLNKNWYIDWEEMIPNAEYLRAHCVKLIFEAIRAREEQDYDKGFVVNIKYESEEPSHKSFYTPTQINLLYAIEDIFINKD